MFYKPNSPTKIAKSHKTFLIEIHLLILTVLILSVTMYTLLLFLIYQNLKESAELVVGRVMPWK